MSLSLNRILTDSVAKYPDNVVLVFGGRRTTYSQLNDWVDRFSSGLAALGVGRGDRVALLLGNSPEFIVSYYGILRLGAVVVPMNPTYATEEIAYVLGNSKAKAAVAHAMAEPKLSPLRGRLPELKNVIYTGDNEATLTFKSLLQTSPTGHTSISVGEDEMAVILYTSGTTGKPKGTMLSHRNLASNAQSVSEAFEVSSADRMVVVLPLFHIFSMTVCLNAFIGKGATLLLIPKFNPEEVVKTIREEKATFFAGVPTMYNYILQLPQATAEDFATVKVCSSGGAPLPVEMLQKFEERFQVTIYEGYGLSEAAPVTLFNQLGRKRKPGSVGTDFPNVINKIVDTEGSEVPRGELGELVVQGPNVMMGYLDMPEATSMTLKDGWLYTGDLARMDEEGYVFIVDRIKDMILVGGYNIYPREIEEVLYQHPDILEAAVVGISDPVYGEAVKAVVVPRAEGLTMESILEFCKDKLAKYKWPRQVEFRTELPKNSSGKTLRKSLKGGTSN